MKTLKTHVTYTSDIIKNDPELQPSTRIVELDEQLRTYSHQAKENLKKWAVKHGLSSDGIYITHSATIVNGVNFFYKWPYNVCESNLKASEFVLEMNIFAMGSFDPDKDSRETRYYTTVSRFMTDSDLRHELKEFCFNYIYGLKKLENELRPLVREHENKVRDKVNEINAQIDRENYELQLEILKSIPADGKVYVINDGFNKTGFTYRNKNVLIAEKQMSSWNAKSVPVRLIRNVGV